MEERRPLLFRTFAREVLARKLSLAPKTVVAARYYISRFVRIFGHLELRKFREQHWARYVAREKKKNHDRRFYDDRKYLNMILLAARREGLIPRRVMLRSPDVPRDVGREVTETELAGLFEHANPVLTFQIEIAYKMGLRLREMLHLKWDRFDWEERVIRLRPEDIKTRSGRVVPINPDVFDRFRSRMLRSHSAFVFPSRFDLSKPQNDNKTAWYRALRKAGVKARWHDLRHTCATLMARRGVPLKVVAVLLGMSEEVLRRIYRHVNVEELWEATRVMSTGCGR